MLPQAGPQAGQLLGENLPVRLGEIRAGIPEGAGFPVRPEAEAGNQVRAGRLFSFFRAMVR